MQKAETLDDVRKGVKVNSAGCWLWMRQINRYGYATYRKSKKTLFVHRLTYTLVKGPIPSGLQIDHLCRVRHCVNPAHLEAVTKAENILRSPISFVAINARRTHCQRGHLFDEANTLTGKRSDGRTQRICRKCSQISRIAINHRAYIKRR